MATRTRIAIISALVFCQIGLGSAAAYLHITNNPSGLPIMPERGAATPSQSSDMLKTAQAQANVWAPGATLVTEVSWLSWPTTAPNPNVTNAPVNGWGAFVFASGGRRLALVVDRGSGFILGQHSQTLGLPAAGELDLSKATVTAETAVISAELLGGRDYRAACPDHRDQTKVGATNDAATGALLWVVTYADDRSASLPDVIVAVDARVGNLVRKTVNNPSCEKS